MKFSVVHFHKQLEISGMPQSNRYLLTAQEGFSLEFDAETGGIIAKHDRLPQTLWLPAVSVAMATILEEESTETLVKSGKKGKAA